MERRGLFIVLLTCLVLSSGIASAEYLNVRWNYTTKATVRQVYIDDLDNDGMKEVIAGVSEERISGTAGWVYLLNKDGNKKWDYTNIQAISSMLVDDLNNDGKKEVIVGVFYNIYFLNGNGEKTANLQISTPNQFGVVDMLAEDIDGDNKKELIVSANSNGGGKIFVYGANRIKKWDKDIKEKVTSIYVSDINNDDAKEVVVGTNGKGGSLNNPAKVYALEPGKGAELWNFETAKGVESVTASDVDTDGAVEIVVGCEDYIYILNNKGQQVKNITKQGSMRTIKVADLDKSGNKYILVGSDDVYALDKDLNVRWRGNVNNEVYGIEVADVDGDGKQEILVESDKFYVLNKDGKMLWEYPTKLPVISASTGDLYDDDSLETVIGSLDRNIYVLESKTQAKMINATRYLSKATDLFIQGNYSGARTYLNSAKKIYSELGAFDKIKECETLYDKINKNEALSLNKKAEADADYKRSVAAYMVHDYRNATMYAERAKNKYPIIETESIDRCNEIIKNSKEVLKIEADSLLENATGYVEKKDYDNAYYYAKKANESYSFLKDGSSVNRTLELLARIKDETGGLEELKQEMLPTNPQTDNTTLIIIAVVILGILAVSFWAIRQATKKQVKEEQGVIADDALIEKVEEGMKKHEAAKKESRKKTVEHAHAAPTHKEERREDNRHAEQKERTVTYAPEKKPVERKPLEKIAKDSFRGYGVSLKGLTQGPKVKEEDISD